MKKRRNPKKTSKRVSTKSTRATPLAWEIEISTKRSLPYFDRTTVRKILEQLLSDLENPPPKGVRTRGSLPFPPPSVRHLSVSFVDDATMHELNLTHRKKDKPTDVLSFAALEASDFSELAIDGVKYPLGDIVISLDTAISQARRYRWSLGEEILRLLIHGLLHLLGYDHERVPVKEAERMRRLERALFTRHRALAPHLFIFRPALKQKKSNRTRK